MASGNGLFISISCLYFVGRCVGRLHNLKIFDMREILFQGVDIHGNWHIGMLACLVSKHADLSPAYYISNAAGKPLAFEVRQDTISQYTGIHDRDGNRVFENDMVRLIWDERYTSSEFIYRVQYFNGAFGYFLENYPHAPFIGFQANVNFIWQKNKCMQMKVIGNHFNTPQF